MAGVGLAPLAIIGGLVSAGRSIMSGVAANNAAKFESKQLERRAQEEFAAGQRESMQRQKEGRLAESRAMALAAASGGGTADATITEILAGIRQQSDYNAMAELYGADRRRMHYKDEASSRRASGKSAMTAGFVDAGSSMFGAFT